MRNDLNAILKTEEAYSRLSFLKKEPKEFSTTEMRKEIQKHKDILSSYKQAAEILPKLGICVKNIDYYNNIVEIYNAFRLKRLVVKNKVYLGLLCYIHQRLRVVNDHLVTFLNFKVTKYYKDATDEA